jgi:hypothetical protein
MLVLGHDNYLEWLWEIKAVSFKRPNIQSFVEARIAGENLDLFLCIAMKAGVTERLA